MIGLSRMNGSFVEMIANQLINSNQGLIRAESYHKRIIPKRDDIPVKFMVTHLYE